MYFWSCCYDYHDFGDSPVRRIGSGVAYTLEDAERYIDCFRHDDKPIEDSLWGYIKEVKSKRFRTVMTLDADGTHKTTPDNGFWYHLEEEEGCLLWEELY